MNKIVKDAFDQIPRDKICLEDVISAINSFPNIYDYCVYWSKCIEFGSMETSEVVSIVKRVSNHTCVLDRCIELYSKDLSKFVPFFKGISYDKTTVEYVFSKIPDHMIMSLLKSDYENAKLLEIGYYCVKHQSTKKTIRKQIAIVKAKTHKAL